MKQTMIIIGNFHFKYRNSLFPLYVIALFLLFQPPVCRLHASQSAAVMTMTAILISLAGQFVRAVVIGLAYIVRGGLNKKVYAADLVTEGMFSVCRNPLYVGNMLIYTGGFLMFGNVRCLLAGVAFFWFLYECIIAAEEDFLRGKFGAAYDDYCRDVPRWLPKLSNIGGAASGLDFNWKKVVFKDYPTMCSTLMLLAAIQLWEVLANHGLPGHKVEVFSLAGALFAMPLAALAVRTIKKKSSLPKPSVSRLDSVS